MRSEFRPRTAISPRSVSVPTASAGSPRFLISSVRAFAISLGLIALCCLSSEALAGAENVRTSDFAYANGKVSLAAELMMPPGQAPFAAAIIVQGSGTSDRTNQWSRDIAGEFVRRGVAVLLTDKRGSGSSGGDWRTSSFHDLAGDLLEAVHSLRGHPEIDAARIGVVGLSQGGQVVPIAAALSDEIAFVVSVSSKAVGFAEGSFLEMANTSRQAGLGEEGLREVLGINRAALRYLTSSNWAPYESTRAQALTGEAKTIAAGFPASPDDPIWTFLRSVVTFDPLPYWIQVSQPTLIFYGEADELDNAPVKESVRRLEHAFGVTRKSDFEIEVIAGVGHGLRDPATHQMSTEFRTTLSTWLRSHGFSRDATR